MGAPARVRRCIALVLLLAVLMTAALLVAATAADGGGIGGGGCGARAQVQREARLASRSKLAAS
jgi:hypothetical protein